MTYKEMPHGLIPNSNEIVLISPSTTFKSAFTGVSQHVARAGAHWELELSFNVLTETNKKKLRAFLNSLGGRVEAVKIYDHSSMGSPTKGDPSVSADNQTGKILNTSGWQPNQKVLEAGDRFNINDELKEIEIDIWSDENGHANLKFHPPLRKTAHSGDIIVTESPYMIATMDSDGVPLTNTPGGFGSFKSVNFIEAIYK